MKIFVTGGTGFIGSHFINHALEQHHEVVALRRKGAKARIPLTAEPYWVDGELGDDLREYLNGCEVLVHLAASGVVPGDAKAESCFEVNVVKSLGLWRSAVKSGIKKLVVCGSCFEYGKAGEHYDLIPADAPLVPTGPYHASKAAATMLACSLAAEEGLSLEIVRPFHVFGMGEHLSRFWPSLRKAAIEGQDFHMTKGLQVRDFIEVEKVAREILSSAAKNAESKITIRNLGSGNPRLLIDFANEWWHKFEAVGRILPGALPDRPNEIMRYAACLSPISY